MGEDAAQRYERFARATFCDGTGATCLIPTFRDSHDGELLRREWAPFEKSQRRPDRVGWVMQGGKLREDSLSKLASV
jgi:hypothetical protein